ncbi:hypothetical protein [uncultured Microbulbifer sp.]|nr:hypothetical protein [uncultured Microbulbifer sp.]
MRKLTVPALVILLALAAAACSRQETCQLDSKRNKPPIPFAMIS